MSVFFDDILIYSRCIEEHLKHLEKVLKIQRENEFYANRKNAVLPNPRLNILVT